MNRTRYVYWQDEDMWIGYLEECPDYRRQGETKEELEENLRDIHSELTSGNISFCPKGLANWSGMKRTDLMRELEK